MRFLFSMMLVIVLVLAPVTVAQNPIVIPWETLEELNYETGEMTDSVKRLDGQFVEVAGFIVPIAQGQYLDTVKEFLLVPNPLACIHVPPPPPNQMIYVVMNKAIPLNMDYRGVAIQGTFTVPEISPDYEFVSFELTGISAEEADIDYEDPLDELIY